MILTTCSIHAPSIDRLICAIQNPASSPLDWTVPLASSLLGAGVGALALSLIFLADRRSRREDRALQHDVRFESALADLMRAMTGLSVSLRAVHTGQIAWDPEFRNLLYSDLAMTTPRPELPELAEADELWSAHEIASMIGDQDEREVLQRLSSAISFDIDHSPVARSGTLTSLVALLRLWRTGDVSQERILQDLGRIADEGRHHTMQEVGEEHDSHESEAPTEQ
jgi:hypothetical protein